MSAFMTLLRKELRESWRTRRLPVVLVLFAIVGLISPLTARYLPEILELAFRDELEVPIPPSTIADAVYQLQNNLAQFGGLTAIVLAMGLVATEKERGTAAFVLVKPASRGAFLAAKLASLGIVMAMAVALATVLAWAYTAVLFEPLPAPGWAALAVLAWLALMAWGSITFLASTVTGSAMAAAGVGIAAILGLSIVAAIPQLGRWLPSGLDPAVAGPGDRGAGRDRGPRDGDRRNGGSHRGRVGSAPCWPSVGRSSDRVVGPMAPGADRP